MDLSEALSERLDWTLHGQTPNLMPPLREDHVEPRLRQSTVLGHAPLPCLEFGFLARKPAA